MEECQVANDGKLIVKAVAGTSTGYEVFSAILLALERVGATGVFAVLYHSGIGSYEAVTAHGGTIETVFTTYNYKEVGDDWFEGMRILCGRAFESLARLRAAGLA